MFKLDENTLLWLPDGLMYDRSLYRHPITDLPGSTGPQFAVLPHVGRTHEWTGSANDRYPTLYSDRHQSSRLFPIGVNFQQFTLASWLIPHATSRTVWGMTSTTTHTNPYFKFNQWIDPARKLEFRAEFDTIRSTTVLSTTQPTWCVCIFDHGRMSVWINGVEEASFSRSGTVFTTNDGYFIWARNAANGERYDGYMYGMVFKDIADYRLAREGYRVRNPFELFSAPSLYIGSTAASAATDLSGSIDGVSTITGAVTESSSLSGSINGQSTLTGQADDLASSAVTWKVTKVYATPIVETPSLAQVSSSYLEARADINSNAYLSNNYVEARVDIESIAYVSSNYVEVLVDAFCFRTFSRVIDTLGGPSPVECVSFSEYYKGGPYVDPAVNDPRTIPQDAESPNPCISYSDWIGANEP